MAVVGGLGWFVAGVRPGLTAVLPCLVLAACSDGVGVPIRRPVELDAGVRGRSDAGGVRDAAGPGDAGRDGGGRGDVPDTAHCAPVADWERARTEEALLEAINEIRSEASHDCLRSPLEPLGMSPALRCAARLHSLDMETRDFIDRTNPDGESPRDRMKAAGHSVEEASEEIVSEEWDVEDALRDLLRTRDDDCPDVLEDEPTSIGIGRYRDLWTIDLARP